MIEVNKQPINLGQEYNEPPGWQQDAVVNKANANIQEKKNEPCQIWSLTNSAQQ